MSLRLKAHMVKIIGPHLSCRFYLTQCKLLSQIASTLPCLPNFDPFKWDIYTSIAICIVACFLLNEYTLIAVLAICASFIRETRTIKTSSKVIV